MLLVFGVVQVRATDQAPQPLALKRSRNRARNRHVTDWPNVSVPQLPSSSLSRDPRTLPRRVEAPDGRWPNKRCPGLHECASLPQEFAAPIGALHLVRDDVR